MLPLRAKRTPKAPTRFSSNNDGAEQQINSTGETILDYTNNTTKTTHTLSPISKAIRLKPTGSREPLKVKLPKLRRTSHDGRKATTKDKQTHQKQQLPSSSSSTPSIDNSGIKIHKIKLPSLLAKKHKQKSSSSPAPSSSTDQATGSVEASAAKPDIGGSGANASAQPSAVNIEKQKYSSQSLLLSVNKTTSNNSKSRPKEPDLHKSNSLSTGYNLDSSATSKTSSQEEGDTSFANTSFNSSSDGEANASGMKIVVSQPDASTGSEIRCPCGVDDDLGVMVECERCSTWQHGHCINVGQEDDAYEGYICAHCQYPKDKFRESLIHLTVGDRFQTRFDQLESLITRNNASPEDRYEMLENNSRLTIDELSQATKDLSRVLNSLKAKWRLLDSQAYDSELRIWQNPYWTDEVDAKNAKDKTMYFLDQCKRNLRLNIRNMIMQMEKRCRLIEYAIELANEEAKKCNLVDPSNEMKVKTISHSLETISNSVKDYKTRSSVQVASN